MEGLGFARLLFTDSQNLCPEVWSQLALAANATERIRLGPGVTNPVTRDPALTACAAVTLQADSRGRALLCIGRGDSAVQRIGLHEQRVGEFEIYLERVQRYLRGEEVDRNGFGSRLEFLDLLGDVPKVPVEVVATGPRVIEVAARQADHVCLAAGADPEYLADRMGHARDAAKRAGRDPGTLRIGAMINCVLHDDVAAARAAVRGGATTFARFSAFRGANLSLLPEPLRVAGEWIRENYDMKNHTRADAPHTKGIDDAFVDWFAVAGSTANVRKRLQALAEIDLDFLYIVPGSTGADRNVVSSSLQSLSRDILPGFSQPS
jgi:5,10-methylenetetrahydromethanopterin reductase